LKQLVIVGTGAVAAETTSFIEDYQYGSSYNVRIRGYLDINSHNMLKYEYKSPYLGKVEDYELETDDYFIIAIGNNGYRKEHADKILQKGGTFINLIHQTCIIANTAKIGIGNIIYPYSIIGPKAQLGDFNLLTSRSSISHDCSVGNFNFFAIASVSGNVSIGHENNFYTQSAVIPKIRIGNRNTIQSGMIVDKDISDDTTVFHRFREKVIAIPKID
jgi:sugar O-acyltransferase (sialic acid O-acetyltransferase NeuD family)